MKDNLNAEGFKIFENFGNKIASLKNENEIISTINKLCESIDTVSIINHLLESMIDDKYYIPHNSVHNKITLFTSTEYEFSIIYNPPKESKNNETYLYSYTNDVFLCPLVNVPNFEYTVYEQNNIEYIDVLNSDAKLKTKTKSFFSENKAVYFKKFKDVLQLDESKPFIMLMVTSKKPPLSFSWEYNAKTLMPIRIVLADITIARLGTTSKILGSIGDFNSKKLVKKLCNHTAHLVRWDAVRALINIDFEEGIEMLQKLTNDSHPEVCDAAKKSLELLTTKID
jgi:hypothetical protein